MSGCLGGLIRTRMDPNDGTSKGCLIGQAGEIGLTMSAARYCSFGIIWGYTSSRRRSSWRRDVVLWLGRRSLVVRAALDQIKSNVTLSIGGGPPVTALASWEYCR
jgi:hypothetical protein